MSEDEPIDGCADLGDTPGVFTIEQSKDMTLDEFVDFAKYRIKDFGGSLIPDPFPEIDLPELTSEQAKSIVDMLTSQAAQEFNARVRQAFRTQFIDQPISLFNMTREEIERSATKLVESGDPVLDGYRWRS